MAGATTAPLNQVHEGPLHSRPLGPQARFSLFVSFLGRVATICSDRVTPQHGPVVGSTVPWVFEDSFVRWWTKGVGLDKPAQSLFFFFFLSSEERRIGERVQSLLIGLASPKQGVFIPPFVICEGHEVGGKLFSPLVASPQQNFRRAFLDSLMGVWGLSHLKLVSRELGGPIQVNSSGTCLFSSFFFFSVFFFGTLPGISGRDVPPSFNFFSPGFLRRPRGFLLPPLVLWSRTMPLLTNKPTPWLLVGNGFFFFCFFFWGA